MNFGGFLGGSVVKNLPTYAGDRRRRLRFDPWVGKIPQRRKWQPTPVFLPEKFHGQRNLGGYSPRGCKESDMTEQLSMDAGTTVLALEVQCYIRDKIPFLIKVTF